MTDATRDTLLGILREYGFVTLLACGLLYVGRQDIIVPMVDAHRAFLRDIAETQREISKAVTEQTRLLYALQPREHSATTSTTKPDGGLN